MNRCAPAMLLLVGCAGWPTASQDPESCSNADCHTVNVDPRSLVQVAWQPQSEAEDNGELGDLATPLRPDVGEGIDLGATLSGTGWQETPSSREVHSVSCSSSVPLVFPFGDEGDYLGDLDWVRVRPGATGTLCIGLTTDPLDAAVGLDVLLYTLDDCLLPGDPVLDEEGEVLGGFSSASRTIEWSHQVDAGTELAVLVAGYAPNDPTGTVTYSAAVSLVPDGPEGEPGLCPLRP